MNTERLSPSVWSLISEELFGNFASDLLHPQKLFLWNANGIYIDYYYPQPTQVHYVGGEFLLGKRITAVLPDLMAKSVRASVHQTLDLQQPMVEHYELCMNGQLYQVVVRFLPFQNNVLGLVTDYLKQSQEKIPPSKDTKGFPVVKGNGSSRSH